MTEIDLLYNQLKKLQYPYSMQKIGGELMKGRAFFPGGKGTLDNSDMISNKRIMILGQDQDNEENYKKNIVRGGENVETGKTWQNIRLFLKTVGIDENDRFFTNAIMGVRKNGKNTGRSPAFADKEYIAQCRKFLLYQIETQKPKLILVLGLRVAEFLSDLFLDNILSENWSKIPNYKQIDSQNLQVLKEVKLKNNIKTDIVLLVHPSYRINAKHRTYGKLTGEKAEIAMIKKLM